MATSIRRVGRETMLRHKTPMRCVVVVLIICFTDMSSFGGIGLKIPSMGAGASNTETGTQRGQDGSPRVKLGPSIFSPEIGLGGQEVGGTIFWPEPGAGFAEAAWAAGNVGASSWGAGASLLNTSYELSEAWVASQSPDGGQGHQWWYWPMMVGGVVVILFVALFVAYYLVCTGGPCGPT